MKALILAAGFGKRMRPITFNTHKTLIKISNHRVIDRIIESLIKNKISDIIVVTGYKHEELVNHINNNFSNLNLTFIYNEKYETTNNIYSLSLAFEKHNIDDDLILIESDLIFKPEIINILLNSKFKNLALVSPYKIGLDGTVVQIKDKKIISIYPPHLQTTEFNLFDKYKTLNIYKFSKDFCINQFKNLLLYYTKSIDRNSYYELVLGIIIYLQKETIYSEIVPNSLWTEIDDPNDLMVARYLFDKKSRKTFLENTFGGYWNFDILDFCFIRNMYFPTDSMLSEIKNNLAPVLQNYGSNNNILNKKLSYVLEVDESNLVLLNGLSQIYPILKSFLNNKRILIPNPTFGEYLKLSKQIDTYCDDGKNTYENLKKKIFDNENIFIVNPNNPTGTTLETENIYKLAKNNLKKFFIVDESFIDFSNQKSIIQYLEKDPLENLIVLTSLSKSYGLPGIRLGYIYSSNINLLNNFKIDLPIWNSNSIAEFYLEIILKYKNELENSFVKTKDDRAQLIKCISEIDFVNEVWQSGGNFILIRLQYKKSDNCSIIDYLINNHNIFVKEVTDKFIKDEYIYLRIAVRNPRENSLLLNALANYKI